MSTVRETIEKYLIDQVELYADDAQVTLDYLPMLQTKLSDDEQVGEKSITWKVRTQWVGQSRSGRTAGRGKSGDAKFDDLTVGFGYHKEGIDIDYTAYIDMMTGKYTPPGFGASLDDRVTTAALGMKFSAQREMMMDGTGRLAKVMAVNKGTTVTDCYITVAGAYSHTTLYPEDGLKLVKAGDWHDIGTIPYTDPLAAESLFLQKIDPNNRYLYYTADEDGEVAADLSNVEIGMFVYLEGNRAKMTLSGNDITIVETKDVVGLMGICGAGTGYTANGSPNVGLLSLYGKLTTDGQAHCPYNYNLGTDFDTAGSWDEFSMRAIEEEAYLLGFGHGDAGGAEPIVVNGKERTPISLIASATTANRLCYDAGRTRTAGGTAFHEAQLSGDAHVGIASRFIYESKRWGPVPVETYDSVPNGILIGVRWDQFKMKRKGPSLFFWQSGDMGPNSVFESTVNKPGGDDEVRATMRSIWAMWLRARNRCFMVRNIAVTKPT